MHKVRLKYGVCVLNSKLSQMFTICIALTKKSVTCSIQLKLLIK